ncbi:MAG: hypothetical protein IJI61_09950 [Oscillospiraceae bacterium]|nr:hypothetical protein [Oscillospiraceae bacterium]
MKHRPESITAVLISLCLLLSVGSAALADSASPREGAVRELYSIDGSYTDDVGNHTVYSWHVPQLNTAQSEAAQEINREISDKFGSAVERELQSMQLGTSILTPSIYWKAYWHENWVFLLVSADISWDMTEYGVYGYDFSTDSRVSNESILQELGITEQEYLEKLREKVTSMFEEQNRTLPEEYRQKGGYDHLLQQTLDWINPEDPIFIGPYGDAETIVSIAAFAGAGRYSYIAEPFL